MQTFEIEYSAHASITGYGGSSSSMRVDADTPADAVEAVKRAKGDVNIISVSAVKRPSVNYAEDGFNRSGNASFACDGMPYRPSNGGRSVAS